MIAISQETSRRREEMFQRILVPLDGSVRAEQAIPVAARIARASNAEIVLLQIVRPTIDYAYGPSFMGTDGSPIQQAIEDDLNEAKMYLTGIANTPQMAELATTVITDEGSPAERIFATIESYECDLVVMNSHGYTGFKRWMLGSVAEKVAGHAMVPVLVLREHSNTSDTTETTPVSALHLHDRQSVKGLVPLDGSVTAKAALKPAAHLAAALSAPGKGALHLTRVVPLVRVRRGIETVEPDTKEHLMRKASIYLTSVSAHLREGSAGELGLTIGWSVELDTDIAATIIARAEKREMEDTERTGGQSDCDFIAMSTHGYEGLQRLAMGSVTSRVLHATRLPLLIVQPEKELLNSSK